MNVYEYVEKLREEYNNTMTQYYKASSVKNWKEMATLNNKAIELQNQINYELYWKKGN